MVLILDDNSEHVAQAWRKIGNFAEKKSICACSRSNQICFFNVCHREGYYIYKSAKIDTKDTHILEHCNSMKLSIIHSIVEPPDEVIQALFPWSEGSFPIRILRGLFFKTLP